MMTLWWANKLKSKDDLHIGQVLRIPPVSGLVVTVKDTDTLESLATEHRVNADKVIELNGLDDPTLVVGQVLVLPGAKGAPIPTPKPTPKPAAKSRASGGGGGGGSKTSSKPRSGGASYNGGQFRWPVVGGGNYISQYAHAGHVALDIAGDYGSPVVAAAGGRVVFAGWKSNGGGWQVWISHGGGLYTTYNHMSGVVGGQRPVGRARPARRPARVERLGDRPAPPLRGLARRDALGRRQPGQPHALLLAPETRRSKRRRPPSLASGPSRGRATITPMFLDDVRISVRAGAGGDGASTMRHEAHVPRGGPDGGDGGRGGSVYLRVDAGQTALHDFRFKHHFSATPGGRGERQKRHGKAGEDLYLAVPPGTAVIDLASGGLIADLVAVGQETMVAKGGRGGLGNVHFATATHQAPKHAQQGEPGEEKELRLELRLIADVGLVGLPNAGKSTLLAALTAATPKIAAYPFTTLEPNLGVMDLGIEDGRRPTIADVPGLIEGASAGAGLGHAFLRHVVADPRAAAHRGRRRPRSRAGTTASSATSSRPTTRPCSPSRC